MQEKRTKTEKTTQPPAKINSEGISMGESTKNEARASYPTLDVVVA